MDEPIGKVTHYFDKIGVAVIKLDKGSLKTGHTIKIKGRKGDFEQKIESMQIEHLAISEAKKGDEFGLKVDQKVKEGDEVLQG